MVDQRWQRNPIYGRKNYVKLPWKNIASDEKGIFSAIAEGILKTEA